MVTERKRSIEEGTYDENATKFVSPKIREDFSWEKKEDVKSSIVTESNTRKTKKIVKDSSKRQTSENSGSIQKEISEEEKYNFFANDYIESESKILISVLPTEVESEENNVNNVSSDISEDEEENGEIEEKKSFKTLIKKKFTTDEILWLKRKHSLTHIQYPRYVSKKESVYDEQHILFLPSMKQKIFIPKSRKDEDDEESEESEEEESEEEGEEKEEDKKEIKREETKKEKQMKPSLKTRTNINIMENRALMQNRRNLLNEENRIKLGCYPVTEPMTQKTQNIEDENEKENLCKQLYEFVPACPVEDFDSLFEWRKRLSSKKGVFQLNIGNIQFISHPLASKEHQIAFDLLRKIEDFKKRTSLHVTDLLHEKLLILRKSLKRLMENEASEDIPPGRLAVRRELDISRRKRRYKHEIRSNRNSLIKEGKQDKELICQILELWNQLKEERSRIRFQNTDIYLSIHKRDTKKKKREEELKAWKEELNDEIEEIIQEEEENHKKEMQKYEKEYQEWKEENKNRKMAMKRKEKRDKKRRKKEKQEKALQMAQDEIILSKPENPKPEPPPSLDIEKIKADVEKNFRSSRRNPGEPILDFEVKNCPDTLTSTKLCPASEKKRRSLVNRTKIWLKIKVNNKLVTEVPPVKLNDQFIITISTPLLIEVVSWPYEIKIEVFELLLPLRQELRASIFLPIPDLQDTEESDKPFDVVDFVSEQRKKSKKETEEERIYKGMLSYQMYWKKKDGTSLVPPGSPIKSMAKLDHPEPELQSFEQSKSDADENKAEEEFDLYGTEGTLCPEEVLDSSVRLKVLRLRNQGVTEFKDLKFVPSLESQVLKKTLENYESRKTTEHSLPATVEEEYEENERKSQSDALVQSIIRKLEEQMTQVKEQPCLKDIVKEEEIPNIGSIGELLSILKPKRPLKPVRKKRDQVRGVGLNNQNVKLIVHITRGFHIPVRSTFPAANDENTSSSDDSKQESWSNIVRPFVEVSFQKTIGRTHSSQGSSPTWNEQLMLPFRPPNNDFTASNLQSIEDNIYFHLFDEVLFDLLEDDRKRKTTVFHQIEKRWLGSLKIPFSTLYTNGKIEGTFRLDCPTLMLGYQEDESLSAENNLMNIESPHLSIYLTLEPTLPPQESLKEFFESTEPDDVIKYGKDFCGLLSSKFPNRQYKTHVLDLFGEFVALNRFIKPISPPHSVPGKKKEYEVQRVAWYVSLLPCLSSTRNNGSIPKLWANSEQFVNLGIGDTDEKAILLTNFLLSLDYSAYLLIGSGIPDSLSCYVLVNINNSWKVICPSTSIMLEINQPISPLKSVYMLISQENIYANCQKFDDPPRMTFDLKSSSSWKHFYNETFRNPGCSSVQPDVIHYQPVKERYWKEIKKKLRIVLRDAFMKWRPLHRTPWNAHTEKILSKLIRSYEAFKMKGKNPLPNYSDLETVMNAYEICGVCIQQNFTTVEAVVEAVFSTGVHSNNVPGIEFALAIDLFGYPGEAASIWIYVASLNKKQ